ncbi:hypothetical protein LWC35_25500 [Pseudonocardia kujensis]|uniref:hypothetical protein n=1 Tax=Pseudonocardia kujensis TaxID=1128675 RepID=UPI001E372527|nr:hypothetical protein [Pseudonocardia kujensis]MCE0766234.1 hypothetical protein [Pseudonocardia kujensis]
MPSIATTTIIVDDRGVRIGTVDEHGQVYDFARVHIGALRPDGVALDFAGRRLGRVAS